MQITAANKQHAYRANDEYIEHPLKMAILSPGLLQGCDRETERLLTLEAHYGIENRQIKSAYSPTKSKRAAAYSVETRGYPFAPQHFLYFLPDPHGHGSLRPTLGPMRFGFGFSFESSFAASLTMSLPFLSSFVVLPPNAVVC